VEWSWCSPRNLYLTAEAEAFVNWHAGQVSWTQAIREHRIHLASRAHPVTSPLQQFRIYISS
jgi:hypothetical protein